MRIRMGTISRPKTTPCMPTMQGDLRHVQDLQRRAPRHSKRIILTFSPLRGGRPQAQKSLANSDAICLRYVAMTSRTRQQRQPQRASTTGVGQRPPFRWKCPTCGNSVVTLVTVSAAPTCSAHTGGGRQMVAERVRFRDLDRPPNQAQEVQNELR